MYRLLELVVQVLYLFAPLLLSAPLSAVVMRLETGDDAARALVTR
jgi:hypothetical protein